MCTGLFALPPGLYKYETLTPTRMSHLLCAPRLQNFTIVGFARSQMTLEEFRDMIALTLTCRIDQRCVQLVPSIVTSCCNELTRTCLLVSLTVRIAVTSRTLS